MATTLIKVVVYFYGEFIKPISYLLDKVETTRLIIALESTCSFTVTLDDVLYLCASASQRTTDRPKRLLSVSLTHYSRVKHGLHRPNTRQVTQHKRSNVHSALIDTAVSTL